MAEFDRPDLKVLEIKIPLQEIKDDIQEKYHDRLFDPQDGTPLFSEHELTQAAMRVAGEVGSYIKRVWELTVEGARLPGMTHSIYDPIYAQSIRSEVSSTSLRVYTDYPGAALYQNGRPPIDLKPPILSGPHAKIARDGHRYNTVPFRHLTPGANSRGSIKPLDNDIYKVALRGQKITPSSEMGQRGIQAGWSVGLYSGLKRQATGKRGTYKTFRTVSSRSPAASWVIGSLPPIDVRRLVEEQAQENLPEIIDRAISLTP